MWPSVQHWIKKIVKDFPTLTDAFQEKFKA
jgi:hypothetical protein